MSQPTHFIMPELPEQARCKKCGYCLRGSVAPRCPECGATFDPNEILRVLRRQKRLQPLDRGDLKRLKKPGWREIIYSIVAIFWFNWILADAPNPFELYMLGFAILPSVAIVFLATCDLILIGSIFKYG